MAKKRSNGEGALRKRKDGRWELSIMVGYHDDGKRKFKYFYGKTQKEVLNKAEKFRQDQNSGLNTDYNYTLAEFGDFWFDGHCDNITPTTQESYKYTLALIKRHLGHRKIAELKAMDVEEFLKTLRREGKSDSYISGARAMLFQILHKAEANDLIRKNPVRFADKMRSREPAKRKDAFYTNEVKLMMVKLPKDRIGNSIRIMLATGMRTQELLALEPMHIAEDGSSIQILQAINMVKGTAVVGQPKSRDSYRVIPVPPGLYECAKALRTTDKKYIWEEGKKDTPCNPSHFRKKYKEAISAVEGVRYLTPHSCRHTYVSQMQALGIPLETIQSLVGHADPSMTEHYLHVQEQIRKQAAEKYSEAFCIE